MNQSTGPVEPALYADAGDGRLDLLYLRCGACGCLTFPASAYGCRQCGSAASEGQTERRPGRARLRQVVTVHQALTPALAAPFVVGELELEDGIIEEGVLAVTDERGLRPGMAMRAIAVAQDDASLACRFEPIREAS